ncbi:MAG: DUF4160 domain-containing protein [Muribaculaceae bacterium]|nr:DUF4160 domain-containing protein [Muribaculaceae bacterium]MDE6796333.1 DUF4160 domain-containing protein [Muribaculaceae bacterium]
MPELFRFFGFTFFFYSREHEPVHVHVEGCGGKAIFDYDENNDTFIIRERVNIKTNDMKRIKRVIEDNKDIILKRWKEHFYGDNK